MIAINRILKNLSAVFFGDLFVKFSGMAIAIILARYLGPEDYGKYSFVIAGVFIFMVFWPISSSCFVWQDFISPLYTFYDNASFSSWLIHYMVSIRKYKEQLIKNPYNL